MRKELKLLNRNNKYKIMARKKLKKYQFFNGKRYKAIGLTYDGKTIGWIECGNNE